MARYSANGKRGPGDRARPRATDRLPAAETPARPARSLSPRSPGRLLAVVALAAVLLFVAIVRTRLADVPLERDEGEYAYAGQLILQGVPPYELVYNMKFPGTYYSYALIMALFGETPQGIRIGLLLVNAATILLVYAIGRRLSGEFAGAIAAASFGLLSIDRWVLGLFAHATHFVLLPALAGLYLLMPGSGAPRSRRLLLAGGLLGTAVVMKQHAVLLLPLGAVLAWSAGTGRARGAAAETGQSSGGGRAGTGLHDLLRPMALLGAGALVPFAILVGLFAWQGVLGSFWFWTFEYAREYVSQVPLAQAPEMFAYGFREATRVSFPLWILGGLGLVALFAAPRAPIERLVICGLVTASFLAACPGFYFREHYFILLLPGVALAVGVLFDALAQAAERAIPGARVRVAAAAAFAAVALVVVWMQGDVLFTMSPRELSRSRYGVNPFVEALEVGEELARRAAPDDRIAVLGSEPEIFFYARRRSATGYIYMYPLMEQQPFAERMRREMVREIERSSPKYLVFVNVRTSWLPQAGSEKAMMAWSERYLRTCYDLIGVADIHSMDRSTILWDEEARRYEPRSQSLLYTFQRKGDAGCTVPE